MKLKKAANYETHFGRRLAVVIYAVPLVPLAIVLSMVSGICQEVPPVFRTIRHTWAK
nr:hypothetical protein [Mesorhizobium loti]